MTTDPNRFANEECPRLFDYPQGFKVLRIERQIDRLGTFMGIEPIQPYLDNPRFTKLPPGAEGWVVVPRLRSLHCPEPQRNLLPALNNVLERLALSHAWQSRGVTIENNLRDGLLRAKAPHLRTRFNTHWVSDDLRAFPAQLGKRFDNKTVSPRRAEVLFDENEFGLDVVTGLSIVVTHWDLLKGGTMRIDCPGSEYAPDGNPNKCTDTPRIDIAHGVIVLDWNWNQRARGLHGPASGWAT